MRKLSESDRRRVAVSGHTEVDQIAVGQIRTGQHRGHSAVDAVEAVRAAQEIRRRLRRAANAGKLGHAVRRDVELVKSLDDRRGNRIVPTAGAQRRYGAFVVAMGKAELVAGKLRMVKLRFGKIGHFGLIVLNPFVLSMNGTPLALR